MATDFLRRVSLFADMPEADLARVAAVVHMRTYRRGAIVFREGDPGEAVYFIRRGRVKVFRVAADGREQIIQIWTDGASFGLVVALDGQPYPASAEVLEDSDIGVLRVADFHQLANLVPCLRSGILAAVGERFRITQARAHTLAVRDVRQRLADYLLQLPRDPATGTVALDLTHEELGGLLGASRETVSRALSDLRRSGAVRPAGSGRLALVKERLKAWTNG